MPTQIQKSDFPPFEEWEEMEIVEDIGTSDEHADPFYRWNNYGIELHEDGLCQAYVIIQDPEEGELPKKIAEGFDSPEAVIEYFRNTEHQKELVGEGVAPEEGEPAPMGDPGALDGPAEEVADAEAEPVPDMPTEEAPVGNAPEPELKEKEPDSEGEGEKDESEKKGDDKDKEDKDKEDDKDKDKKDVKKSEVPEEPASDAIQKAVPEEADPFPPIKSFAEIREEYMKAHAGSSYVASTPATHTSATVIKTAKVNTMAEINNTAIAKSETAPVKKSIQYGEIPSWQDIKNGYQFVTEAPSASIAKAEAAGSPPPEQMPEDVPAEAPAEGGDLSPEELEVLAQALGMSPEEIQQMLANPEGQQQLLQMVQALMAEGASDEGAPAEEAPITDDGLQRKTSTPDLGL